MKKKSFIRALFIILLIFFLVSCKSTSTKNEIIKTESSTSNNVFISTWISNITKDTLSLPNEFPITMAFRPFELVHFWTTEFSLGVKKLIDYNWIHWVGGREWNDVVELKKIFPNKIITVQDAPWWIRAWNPSVWPWHLLYKPWTLLTKDISSKDIIISVKNYTNIVVSSKRLDVIKKSRDWKHLYPIIIYQLNENWKPDWDNAEHATVDSIDDNWNLTITRGQFWTKSRDFKAWKTVVATEIMFWTNQWQLNMSLDCPRWWEGNLTASEWFAETVAKRIKDNNADWVEFDVGRWTWWNPETWNMDINNDLIVDYWYRNWINSFWLWYQVFFKKLRELLGDNKIIQIDSNGAMFGMRWWNYLNGVQMEAFPRSNDYYHFSESFLHLKLWVENAKALPKVSYWFWKVATTTFSKFYLKLKNWENLNSDWQFRVTFASDLLLWMPHPFMSALNNGFDPMNPSDKIDNEEDSGIFNWDEYHWGDINNWLWLWKPLINAKRYISDLDNEDLLSSINWEWKNQEWFVSTNKKLTNNFSSFVTSIPNSSPSEKLTSWITLYPTNSSKLIPWNEYTIEFEARGDDTWNYNWQKFDNVPRMISISGSIKGKNDNPMSVLVDNNWRKYSISFIANESNITTPVFWVSEQIWNTEIKNIKMFKWGSERRTREFENWMVLLNMTNNDWEFKVEKWKYKKLKGSQNPDINNGELVDEIVKVPSRDAVFIIKR